MSSYRHKWMGSCQASQPPDLLDRVHSPPESSSRWCRTWQPARVLLHRSRWLVALPANCRTSSRWPSNPWRVHANSNLVRNSRPDLGPFHNSAFGSQPCRQPHCRWSVAKASRILVVS